MTDPKKPVPEPTRPHHLVFRTRYTEDIILCDYCQHYKCNWLDFSPSNYPKSCPGAREFWIADGTIDRTQFMRRADAARRIGFYNPYNRTWHLDAIKARNLSTEILKDVIDDIRTWSQKNDFTLCKVVDYIQNRHPRTAVQAKLVRDDVQGKSPDKHRATRKMPGPEKRRT